MRRAREHFEECAIHYIHEMANIDSDMRRCAENLETLNARLEAIGAVQYDRIGGRGGYVDAKPATLDDIGDAIDAARRVVQRFGSERIEASRIFASSTDATIAWLKYGRRMTWYEVSRETGYSQRTARRRERAGLEQIYRAMPNEYKQVKRCDT